jgi:L,D-peptidoglycan transpeptidase YkuD (ErfK/YbiS/YcfS/YnhG family)
LSKDIENNDIQEQSMKIYRMKTAILLISFILYIFLTGCSKSVPTQSQEDTITVTPTTVPMPSPQAAPTEAALPTQPEKTSPTAAPAITDKLSTDDPVAATPDPKPTKAPAVTPAPKPSKVPAITPAPKPSKAPAVTQRPTDPPVATLPPSDTQEDTSGTAPQEDFAAKFTFAPDISQLVVVVGNGGSDCTVSFHKKEDNSIWTQIFSTSGDCGSKGITYHKKEGDGKTPAGLYSFTIAFGIKSDPGAKLTYRKVTEYDYWIDDSKSPYYNTWINASETPGEYTSEHLIDHAPQYNYALNINYNPDNTPGLGSAIFLHGYNGLGRTTGCVAIAEKYVKTLIREVDSSTKILIVPESADLANYE